MGTYSVNPVRWGIIGAGRIAETFANDIQFTKQAKLVAIASSSESRAKTFAKKFSLPMFYADYDALLSNSDIDAVYIATPHSHHRQQCILALEAGKHVLCEKPATVTPEELEDVLACAKKAQKYYMEGMWTYFMPVIKQCQLWVNQGRIGKQLHVKAEFGFPLPYSPDLREYDNRLGGGCLLEMGIYPIAMAWMFLQSHPKHQSLWHHKADNGVEDDVVILNDYGDSTAQLSTSFRSKLNNYLTLIGDEGTITVKDYWAAREAKLFRGQEMIDSFVENRPQQGFNHQIEQVSCDIAAGKIESDTVSWDDSRAFQQQMAAIKNHF